ncbi:MAG: phospholipase D-like domain-containing protein, partial [Anaerolineales bacterium]|nr:phospholipase D-like domain-containing protein [Anaerolineales bacterium]
SPTPSGFTSPDQIFSIYFTAPGNDEFKGGPDQYLVEALDQARGQIDAALYDLNLWSIRNALIRAHNRGVVVRLVVEEDSLDRTEIQELIEAGIPVVPDGVESLMHNKFFIIDHTQVWTGSMNLTVNGAYRHLNNLVSIHSTRVAENYSVEFEEMFLEGYFGEISLADTPYPDLTINGIRIETYFSPDDSTAEHIIHLILEAEESIEFLYYAFTSDGIADALIFQANQGIVVRGVLDAFQESAGLGGEYQRFQDSGLNVFLDAHPEKLHHKVLIIDDRIVLTGSYNLTRSAEIQNDENTLVIHNAEIAQLYLGEFEWIYEEAASR